VGGVVVGVVALLVVGSEEEEGEGVYLPIY